MKKKKKNKGLLKRISSAIARIFKPIVVSEEVSVRVEPEQIQKIESALRRENAELWGKLVKAEEKIKKLEKIIRTLKKEYDVEIIKEASLHEEVIKKVKAENRYAFIFKKSKKIPVIVSVVRHKYFRDGYGRPYKYWRGIEFENTPNGTLVNLLVSRRPNDDVLGRIPGPPIQYFPYLFTNIYGLVQDLKTGFVVVNISPDGTFIPPSIPKGEEEEESEEEEEKDDESESEEKKGKRGRKKVVDKKKIKRAAFIDIAHLIKTKDPEEVDAILTLYKKYSRAEGEKLQSMQREKEALLESIEAKVESESYKRAMDRATAFIQKFFEELDTVYSKLQETKSKELTARMKKNMTELVNSVLWSTFKTAVINKIPKLSREERDLIREEIRKDIDLVSRRIADLMFEKLKEEKGGGGA